MLPRLLLLFIVVPLVELALLLYLATLIPWWYTLLLVLVTGIVGATLARRQGAKAWARIGEQLAAGRLPGAELVDAVLILIAGVVLITPGVITDAIGLLLLLPPTRRLFREWLIARLRSRIVFHRGGMGGDENDFTQSPRDVIIDSRLVDDADDQTPA